MIKQKRTKSQQMQTTKRKANTFAGLKKARLQWTPCHPYRTIIVWYDIDNPEPLKVAGIDYDPAEGGQCGAKVTEYLTDDDLYLILDANNDEHQAYFTEQVATEGFKAMGALFDGA